MIVFTITKFMLFRDYFVTNEEKNQKYSIYGVVEENRLTRKTFPVNVDSGKITVLILVNLVHDETRSFFYDSNTSLRRKEAISRSF
jgi:hypothetical protein